MLFAAALALAIASPKPAAPSCAAPFQSEGVVRAVTPVYPNTQAQQRLGDRGVPVLVTLSPDGTPVAARVQVAFADKAIDRAAVRAAMESTYRARIVRCRGVRAQLVYVVHFTVPQPPPAASPMPGRLSE